VSGLVLTIRIILVRAAFAASRPLPLRSRVVLATAHSARLAGNLVAIRDELAQRSPPIPVVVLAHRPTAGLRGRLAAAWQAIVAGHYLATSRVFIVDDYFFPVYVIRPRHGTTIIQTWHACGAFKKVGYSVLDKSFGVDEALARRVRIHSNYDVCLVACQAAAPHYAEAFRQPLEKFVSRLGIPRTDVFFGEERLARPVRRSAGAVRTTARGPLRSDLPRGQRDGRARQMISTPRVAGRARRRSRPAHPPPPVRPFTDEIDPSLAAFAIDVSDHPDIHELMLVSDVLITDYSSAIYEFALLGRPMIFFAPDYEAYERERGFYFDYRTGVPGPIFETTGALAEYLRAGVFDTDRVERFRQASFDIADGHSATYVTDELILPSLSRAGDRP
jgi:CDP-ribitol ribitolphosphotransferase